MNWLLWLSYLSSTGSSYSTGMRISNRDAAAARRARERLSG